jgi:tRNA-binding protein
MSTRPARSPWERRLSRPTRPGYHPRAVASADDLLRLDVRVGTVLSASVLKGARVPSYRLDVDLGELGRRRAAVEIGDLYDVEELVGLQVVAVVNLPPRTESGFESQALVLTVSDRKGGRVLIMPERPVPDGGRIG